MPLNYDKWATLEVSDDSDIEGHPNIDHKSLVRWKQRDIHEKRMARNHKIAQLQADIDCDTVLRGRLVQIVNDVKEKGITYFSQLIDRLRSSPSPDRPPQNGPNDPTYDSMILALLSQVWEQLKEEGVDKDDSNLNGRLLEKIEVHVVGLKEAIDGKGKELEEEMSEKTKKITSEDMHEGWDSKYTPAKPAPEPLVKPKEKKIKKDTTTAFETINRPSASPAAAAAAVTPTTAPVLPAPQPAANQSSDEDDDDDLPSLTPTLLQFSKLEGSSSDPLSIFRKSFEFIQAHPEVYVEGAADALMVEALTTQFRAAKGKGTQAKKDAKYAYQCVHQGSLIQFCEKLGKDGVRLFFQKMMTGDKVAMNLFKDDVQKTYKHIVERGMFHAQNADTSEKETIQLVAEGEGASITFNVPDGPPPADLRLSEEAADLDIEEVRKALQLRWDLFETFSDNLQKALKSESLEKVNKVLAGMSVEDAEDVVQKLQMGGMLLFSEEGIRDATGGGGS